MSDSHAAMISSRFDQAYRRAQRNRILDTVRGRSHALLPFDAVSARLSVRQHIDYGVQTVRLDQIVGTVGKLTDFDRRFQPARAEVEERWVRVEHALRDGVSLPPIELYRIGDIYFVVDGHHRVSVAREQGFLDLEARVIGLVVDVPLASSLTMGDLDGVEQQSDFYAWTNLRQLRPDATIETTRLNTYLDLIVDINRHRARLREERGVDVAAGEAVGDWYDRRYLPVVTLIRERRLLATMPNRTEADLFICLVSFQQHLGEQTGCFCTLEDTLDVYVGYVPASSRPWGRLGRRVLHILPPSVAAQDAKLLARLRRQKHTHA